MTFNALPHVTIIFKKKRSILIFKKLMVTRGNALENRQLSTYFTEDVLDDIQ